MKCFHCKKEILVGENYMITSPDGDPFHNKCHKLYEREKEYNLKHVFTNERLFLDWLGVPDEHLNK